MALVTRWLFTTPYGISDNQNLLVTESYSKMWHWLSQIEAHKELADLGIKTLGIAITIVGAGSVAWKYFADLKDERRKTELDLRREAYFDYFSAIPLQLAALGRFWANRDAIVLPSEAPKALHRLHLLANHKALECVIRRNTLYHEGVVRLTALKRTAMQLEAASEGVDPRMFEASVKAWERFRATYRDLIRDLSANYRELIVHARQEIGLPAGAEAIVSALEREAAVALETLDQLSAN
ncbi:MAG TPA: hypothetical protein VHE61_15870 [Opitutaceae bacterium]|nr:hypothetical protein [Opitutaceae bacterium]